MIRTLSILSATAIVLLTPVAAADAASGSTAEAVLAGLQAWLDDTEDLEGAFRQSLMSGALGSGLEERGRLYVKRPGRMRWDYREPDRKVAIVDGDRTWLFVAEEDQLYLGRLGEHGALLPALMAADRRLSEWFDAELLAPSDDGVIRLRLTPKGEEESFESVTVGLRPSDHAIESAEVLDAAGNRMLYRFSKMRRNTGVPDGLFAFEPPAGTSIVGAH